MPSAVVDGEGGCWFVDTGTRERRVDLEGLGLVGFFMAAWGDLGIKNDKYVHAFRSG